MALQKPRYRWTISVSRNMLIRAPRWISVKPNPPVHAAAAGTVYAGRDVDGANYVVIRHDNVIAGKLVYTLYYIPFLSTAFSSAIKLGDRIGVMGQTGNAVGVHLHFEFWIAASKLPYQMGAER